MMKIHVKTYVVVYHDENTCKDMLLFIMMKIHVKTYVVVYHDENTCNDICCCLS